MSFAERRIRLTFVLGEGSFGNSGQNTVVVEGLRATAKIIKAGGPSMGTALMQVFGMKLAIMNRLSTLGMTVTLLRRNSITVEAGDLGGTMSIVFIGTIRDAYGDFSAQPQVPFVIEAHAGLIDAIAPAPPSSYRGPVDVATVMSSLATHMGLSFENNGVNAKLPTSYFPGSAREQALACVRAASIEWNGGDNGKLAIWNVGQGRGGEAPLISPATGLVGYPAYTSKGIQIKCLFNPSIGFGSKINVQSSLTPACGTWVVYKLQHDLDALVFRGKWFSVVDAYRFGTTPVVG